MTALDKLVTVLGRLLFALVVITCWAAAVGWSGALALTVVLGHDYLGDYLTWLRSLIPNGLL